MKHVAMASKRGRGMIPGMRRDPLNGSPYRDAGSAACVHAEFRDGLFFALCLRPRFFSSLSPSLESSALIRHSMRRGTQVCANALGALGLCHALRLSPMTAFYANAIALITQRLDLSV